MELIIVLVVLTFLFRVGGHVTGALLSLTIWLLIRLPAALILIGLGVACCVTLILIPVGLLCFQWALQVIFT